MISGTDFERENRLYARGCGRKRRHETKAEALVAKVDMVRKRRPSASTLEPYQCRFCDGWHLGHSKDRSAA